MMCSFFSGYPVTGSFARTAVNAACQARSPMSATIATLFAATTLMVMTPILVYIPKVALATIVLVAVIKLIHIREAIFLWRMCKRDFVSFVTIVIATLLFGVQAALILGILVSWILFMGQTHPADAFILARPTRGMLLHEKGNSMSSAVEEWTSYVDILDLDREQAFSDHVVVLRLYGDLRFATAGYFKRLLEQIVNTLEPLAVVVDCTTVIGIDGSGVHILRSISESLYDKKIALFLAALPAHSIQVLQLAQRHTPALQGLNGWDVGVQDTVSGDKPRAGLEIFTSVPVAIRTAWAMAQSNRGTTNYGATGAPRSLTARHVRNNLSQGEEKMHLVRAPATP